MSSAALKACEHHRSSADSALQLLREAAQAEPGKLFLRFGEERWTYDEMWTRATAFAGGLRELGVGAGNVVASMLDNNADGVAAWFGANLLGAVWVGINTALRGDFLRHVLDDTGASVVLCERDFEIRFSDLAPPPALEVLLVRGVPGAAASAVTYHTEPLSVLANSSPLQDMAHEPSSGEVSLLVYTGGTTGPSKGCTVTHGYVLNLARCFLEQTARKEHEVNWSPLPMYHFNLIGNTLAATLMIRSEAAIAPRFSVSGFWPSIKESGASVVNLLGSMGTLIAQMDDTPEMEQCRGQIRVVHGSPFPPPVQAIWRERFGVEKVGGTTYGLTEAVPLTTLAYGEAEPPGSSGKRNERDFDVRIFDEQDREVGPNEVGEIVARPKRPNVMFRGYWRRPEATVAATRDLWFRTGDLGRFDEHGYFYFVDRKQDYLRRRGENISSQELEQAYLTHPDVRAIAAHAVPAELGEDDVKITVIRTAGSTLQAEDLFEWSKERVPYFALPRYIEFRDSLPVTPLGRVNKQQLRDEGCTPTTWDREHAGVIWERR